MPQSSYPDGDALKAKLEAAGLVAPDSDTLTIYASAGVETFNKAVGRIMLAGDSETRRFDPAPYGSEFLFTDDFVGTPTIVWQPNGSDPATWTEGTEYDLFPMNAAAKGKPYEALRFRQGRGWGWGYYDDPLGGSYQGAVRITARFGYGEELPDSVWAAMVALGCAALAEEAGRAGTGGVVSWQSTATGYSETYGPNAFKSLVDSWQSSAQMVVAQYRKTRV